MVLLASPIVGLSPWIPSAPRPAMSVPAIGADKTWANSTTFKPRSTPVNSGGAMTATPVHRPTGASIEVGRRCNFYWDTRPKFVVVQVVCQEGNGSQAPRSRQQERTAQQGAACVGQQCWPA